MFCATILDKTVEFFIFAVVSFDYSHGQSNDLHVVENVKKFREFCGLEVCWMRRCVLFNRLDLF